MATLTNTDPTDNTSLVGKTGDPVAGVPLDQAERRAMVGGNTGGNTPGTVAAVPEPVVAEAPAPDNILKEPKDALEEQAAFQASERERLYKQPVVDLPGNKTNTADAAPKTAQDAGGNNAGPNATAGAPEPTVTEEPSDEVKKTARQLELQQAYDAAQDAAESIALQPYKTQTPTRLTTYEDMFRAQHKDPTPTMDELLAEAKRNRRNRIFASIGDFATAVSNIGTTMAGAPNIQPSTGILKAYDDNLKRLRDLRSQDTALWERGLQFAQSRDDKAYNTAVTQASRTQSLEQKDRQMAINMYTRIAQNIEKAMEAEAKGEVQAAQLLRERARADYERAKASKYGALVDSQIKRNLQQGEAAVIRANKTGSGSGSGGGKNSGGKYPLTINGKTTHYNSDADRAIAAQRYAKEHNIEIVSADGYSKPTNRDIVVSVESATRKQPAASTSGSQGGKQSSSQASKQKKKIGW